MIVWSLIIVVTVKYVLILLRADNNGEGGTLSLTALAMRALGRRTTAGLRARHDRRGDVPRRFVHHAGISVLSAVEGLKLRDAGARSTTSIPITLADSGRPVRGADARHRARGDPSSGRSRSPGSLRSRCCGALHIFDDPGVLQAINPVLRSIFSCRNGSDRAGDARRCLPRGDRW